MKLIFTLTFLLLVLFVNATGGFDSLPSKFKATAITVISPGYVGRIGNFHDGGRAWSFASSNVPLFVVDGELFECNELNKIDPDNIASIDILRRDKLPVFGCRPFKGDIILITTKSFFTRKFIIKDFLTGVKIPAATIRFISIKDTITAIADETGILVIDKLTTGREYNITISSAGYKTFNSIVKGKEQEILLEKDVKTCGEVIVVGYPRRGCGRICHHSFSCTAKGIKIDSITDAKVIALRDNILTTLIFPNPVQRNTIFNLEFENKKDETMQLAIISMNGSIISVEPKQINKGLNQLSITADAKWAAGIYNIQLRNEKGTLIRQEKLVVQ